MSAARDDLGGGLHCESVSYEQRKLERPVHEKNEFPAGTKKENEVISGIFTYSQGSCSVRDEMTKRRRLKLESC